MFVWSSTFVTDFVYCVPVLTHLQLVSWLCAPLFVRGLTWVMSSFLISLLIDLYLLVLFSSRFTLSVLITSVIFTTCSNSCGLYLLRLSFPSESLTLKEYPIRSCTSYNSFDNCALPLSNLFLFSNRGMGGGGMGGWVGLRVGFININDMYNNDVGQGVVYAYEAYEAK